MSLETWSGSKSAMESTRRAAARLGHRLALSLYAGLSLYCVLSILFGPVGLVSYHRLEERKASMLANLAELESIHSDLGAELESLKTNPDRAAREARSLGYLRKGETEILLGEKTEQVEHLSTGKVLPYAEPSFMGDPVLKRLALGACLAVLAFLLASRGGQGDASRGGQGSHRRKERPRPIGF